MRRLRQIAQPPSGSESHAITAPAQPSADEIRARIATPDPDRVWHLRYDDRCVRRVDGWQFAHRALTLLLVEARPVARVLPFDPGTER